jgi:hypothetical protein
MRLPRKRGQREPETHLGLEFASHVCLLTVELTLNCQHQAFNIGELCAPCLRLAVAKPRQRVAR